MLVKDFVFYTIERSFKKNRMNRFLKTKEQQDSDSFVMKLKRIQFY